MRNLTISTGHPSHLHCLDELVELDDANQAAARRIQLDRPTMGYASAEPHAPGYALHRTQPRDGRGRFLSRSWLASAETYSDADLAWFRHPVGAV